MTRTRFVRRGSATRDDYLTWGHVAYFVLIILAVLIVTVVLGYWSPAS